MKKIIVGIIGSGYASILHIEAYKKIYGIEIVLKTIVDLDIDKAKTTADNYGFLYASSDYMEILKDNEIDVVDICTPPKFHKNMITEAFKMGKHVICEKPLTGYFGIPGDVEPIGKTVDKELMYTYVIKELEEIKKTILESGKKFMYAENYPYCPSITKAVEIIKKKNSKILFMKGEESLKGSSSPVAGCWSSTGGGTLIRIGCHPLSGIIHLKNEEAKCRNENISVTELIADFGYVLPKLSESEKKYFTASPKDVEDISTLSITFSDGSKALIIAADTCLGGTKNYIEIYCNDSTLKCNLTPTNLLETYLLDEKGLENYNLAEMLSSNIGWNNAFVSDEVIRGYNDEMQDFMECIIYDREPISNFKLAYECIKIIYAAYISGSTGKKFVFND